MKGRHLILAVFSTIIFVMAMAVCPSQAKAAAKSDVSAYKAVFDAEYYYNANPDVAAAYGMNANALFTHYLNFGMKEGRSASAEFNLGAYMRRYSDLQDAFGGDLAAYCRHYLDCGIAEGRNASSDGQLVAPLYLPASGTTSDKKSTTEQKSNTEAVTAASGTAIGSYATQYETGVPRAQNVELAAQRVNGTVVQPGQSFSFSKTILPRTSQNGYVKAPIFISGKVGTGIGGGVCQVSSTLYAAMVSANLPATERHAHSLPVDYLPAGLDATIAGNYLDLRFTNTFSQPLLIQASAGNGTVTVTLVLQ